MILPFLTCVLFATTQPATQPSVRVPDVTAILQDTAGFPRKREDWSGYHKAKWHAYLEAKYIGATVSQRCVVQSVSMKKGRIHYWLMPVIEKKKGLTYVVDVRGFSLPDTPQNAKISDGDTIHVAGKIAKFENWLESIDHDYYRVVITLE